MLTKGKTYDLDSLVFVGWTNPNKEDLEGYDCWLYFDHDDVYLGPDEFGVEPDFDVSPTGEGE